ncbi:MAG: putative monovalent cation/H+ antiporter subunit A [Balneolales bacterium]|nr:putative monovalent cation/H+ antiporter subunit A [Balneolales bacterium]
MTILFSVLLIFGAAFIGPMAAKYFRNVSGWVLALFPLTVFVYLLSYIPLVSGGEVFRESYTWVSYLGINLSFYLDGFSLMFALIVSGVGTFIMIYGGGYLGADPKLPRFYFSILLFMGSMLGVVLADNIIALFIFWELTSISSYLLIGYKHEKEESRKSALQALLITGSGGLVLLAGLILLGMMAGTMEISEMLSDPAVLADHPWYLGMLICILIGAFTKSAQFPFHFWLPGAMAAPTPVSAYLHSATMVKAGIYLLARLSPVISGTVEWTYIVTITGAITMLISAWLALAHTDLKKLLAYSTVMALGTLTMLLGMGHEYAVKAVAVFILGHSLYKGALFMVAGTIDHEAGTRDVTQLGGLRKLMPFTATFGCIAALSMAGIAPLLGFIGKELVYEAALSAAIFPMFFIFAAVAANVAVVATSAIVVLKPFFGEFKETPKKVHEAPVSMWIGPAFLSVLSILFGVLPFMIDGTLITKAAASIAGTPELVVSLSLWHGINAALILSVLTLLSGIGVFFLWDNFRSSKVMQGYDRVLGVAPKNGYEHTLNGILSFASAQTRFFQNGYLRYYLLTLITFFVVLTGYTIVAKTDMAMMLDFSDIMFYEWILAGVIITAAFAAVFASSGLVAIAALGVVGYSISLVYVLFSAPDLAITQVLVETLTVILVALVLVHIPKFQGYTAPSSKIRDGIIAAGAGLVVTLVMLAVLTLDFDPYMSEYFAENSYVVAYGRNIVNVILVDFRALDTFGEIVVLGVAGVGVYGLIKFGRKLHAKEGTNV